MSFVTLEYLRTPQMMPARLREHITQWGMTVLGVATLFTMWVTGVAGWHVLAPAILILLLVQGARYVRWDLMRLPIFDALLAGLGLDAGLYRLVAYRHSVQTLGGVNHD